MVKVLIVDDEAPILQSTAVILRAYGFQTATVSEARHILPTLEAERPDVLLQDVRMPGLALRELLEGLRAGPHRDLPVVLFSASISLPDLVDAFDVDAVVEKPFRPEALVSALRGAIEKRRPAEPA